MGERTGARVRCVVERRGVRREHGEPVVVLLRVFFVLFDIVVEQRRRRGWWELGDRLERSDDELPSDRTNERRRGGGLRHGAGLHRR
jgi:hypothetical protein